MKFLTLSLILMFLTVSSHAKDNTSLSLKDKIRPSMTLKEVLKKGLTSNFDLRIKEIDTQIAVQELKKISASYKPFLNFSFFNDSNEKLQNSVDFASTNGIRNWNEENWSTDLGIQGKTRTGTVYSFDYNVESMDNSLNSQAPSLNALFNPEVETFMGITVTHPLLKNSGKSVNLLPEKVAGIEIDALDFEKKTHINNMALRIADSFYSIIFAEKNIEIKKMSLLINEKFKKMAKRKHELGQADKADVYQAEIQVSESGERLLLAQDNLRRARADLYKIAAIEPGFDHEPQGFVFSDLKKPEIGLPNFKQLVEFALENRPDYLAGLKRCYQADARHDYSVKQILPQLDVSFSYGFNGLGNSFSNSNDLLNEWHEPRWSAGFNYKMPLGGFNSEKAEERIMFKRKEQQEISLDKLRTNILIEVRDAIDRLLIAEKLHAMAEISSRTADKALKIEEQRYSRGRTSIFTVLDIQKKLFSAQTRELSSLIDLYKALDQVSAVTGNILSRYGFYNSTLKQESTEKRKNSKKKIFQSQKSAFNSKIAIEKLRDKLK